MLCVGPFDAFGGPFDASGGPFDSDTIVSYSEKEGPFDRR